MRFALSIPASCAAGWKAESERRIVSTSGAAATIVVGAMAALPDDLEGWVRAVMQSEPTPGAEIRINGLVRRETVKQWPWRLVDAVEVAGDVVVERRFGGFYRFFEYGAVALVRLPGPVLDEARAADVVAILETAEPDWSSEVVAVHQLWQDD